MVTRLSAKSPCRKSASDSLDRATGTVDEGMCPMPGDYSLEVGKDGNAIVVRLGKHQVLDELMVTKIGAELLAVADRTDCDCLLLDFSGVKYLSSAMLAKMVALHRTMELKREKLRLTGVNPQIRSVLATTRLDRVFDIENSQEGDSIATSPQPHRRGEKTV